MMKRILIAGGYGYIGSRLAQYLSQEGYEVVLGSRNAKAPPHWLKDAEVVETLWEDQVALQKICNGIDVVIHAAGMNAQDCASDPVGALEFNGLATARFVSCAAKARIKSFVYLSTAHVYADALVGRITEESCPRNSHPYAASHLAGELAVLHGLKKNRIHGGVLRLSNGFGAPVYPEINCWHLFVNNICRQIVRTGQAIITNNSGKHYDFLPMNNLVKRVFCFANTDNQLGNEGKIYLRNIGASRSLTLENMSRLIQTRCREVLGFTPNVILQESTRSEPLYYGSIYSDSLSRMDLNETIEEIDLLLRFCYASFKV